MIFNGHTAEYVDNLDEETFVSIQIMYHDGIIGNRGILLNAAQSNVASWNTDRDTSTPPFKLEQFLGTSYGYMFKEYTAEERRAKAAESLGAFMHMNIEAKKARDGVK